MEITKKGLGIYIHIPFCKRKCNYCDFCSYVGQGDEVTEKYTARLCEELERAGRAACGYEACTVYFGGGTPTLLSADKISRILTSVRENFELSRTPEITLECNPASFREGYFEECIAAGVNRISIGLQSANDEELEVLGRLHTRKEFERTYFAARRAGFDNISIDLMYGIPNQTKESFRRSLEYAVSCSPEHISSYLLKIEEGTPFYEREGELMLPDEDTQFEMYAEMTNYLRENGYYKYEISNFARRGFESRHNSSYWTGGEFIGLGVAAYSYFGGERYGNSRSLEKFLAGEDILSERETIDEIDGIFEYVMLRLRMTDGVDRSEYREKFGREFDSDFPSAKHFERAGLLVSEGDRVFFSDRGFFVSNTVLSEFLSDFSKTVDRRQEVL